MAEDLVTAATNISTSVPLQKNEIHDVVISTVTPAWSWAQQLVCERMPYENLVVKFDGLWRSSPESPWVGPYGYEDDWADWTDYFSGRRMRLHRLALFVRIVSVYPFPIQNVTGESFFWVHPALFLNPDESGTLQLGSDVFWHPGGSVTSNFVRVYVGALGATLGAGESHPDPDKKMRLVSRRDG